MMEVIVISEISSLLDASLRKKITAFVWLHCLTWIYFFLLFFSIILQISLKIQDRKKKVLNFTDHFNPSLNLLQYHCIIVFVWWFMEVQLYTMRSNFFNLQFQWQLLFFSYEDNK